MTLPVLTKPQLTTGDPQSHLIDILLNEKAAPSTYPIDMVVQKYCNHNSVIYKVYAIEDAVFIEKRYSLPNASPCEVGLFRCS